MEPESSMTTLAMDSADGIETNSDLKRDSATTGSGEGDHSITGQQLNRTLSPLSSSSSESSLEEGFQLGTNKTANTPPLGSTDFPTLDEENGLTALKCESDQTFLNTGNENVSIGSSASGAIPATTSNEAYLSIPDEELDNLSSPPSYPQIIARATEDSCVVTVSDDLDIGISSKPIHVRDRSLSSSSLSSPSSSSSEDSFQHGANGIADISLVATDAPLEENGSIESNQTFSNPGDGNVSIASSDSRAIPATISNDVDLSSVDKTLDDSVLAPSSRESECSPRVTSQITVEETEDSPIAQESCEENIRVSSKPMEEHGRSLSSSSSSSSSSEDPIKLGANASHASECPPEVNSQMTVRETENSLIVPESSDENIHVGSNPMQEHGRSLSTSSSSSSSSSEGPFQLNTNETANTPLGSTDPSTLEEDNGLTTLTSEPSQTFSSIEHMNTRTVGNDSSSIPTITSKVADLSIPDKILDNSLSSPASPAYEYFPKGLFRDNARDLEDSRIMSRSRDEEIRVTSKPIHEQQHSHEIAGSPTKPAAQGYSKSNSATQFPPTQVMERPNDPSSSGYRIPSYVFARTKSTAPMEWSTASNESLFSIHMGNMSFNRDQLFWLGKSGELGLSGPLMDLSSSQPPTNNKASHSVQNSATLDDDFRAAEEKAAETMREVIRESAENRCKEDARPSKDTHASSKISRQPNEKTKSFAFPL